MAALQPPPPPPPSATAGKAGAVPPTILAVASLVPSAGADEYRLDLFERAGASARATPLWDGAWTPPCTWQRPRPGCSLTYGRCACGPSLRTEATSQLKLTFCPLHLTHMVVKVEDRVLPAFVLAGVGQHLHVYAVVRGSR